MNLNATSWEVWLPEDRKPQSLILTDDVTALVLTTTGLVYYSDDVILDHMI